MKLQEVLATVPGLRGCFRDRDALESSEHLPAAILLDGREELSPPLSASSYSDRQHPTVLVVLEPQVFVQLVPRDDKSNDTIAGAAAPIGPELSAFRIGVLKAVLGEINLVALLGSNGRLEYRGSDTDMQTGSLLVGMIQFHFRFTYVLNPREFA